jgi:hypothetical protein
MFACALCLLGGGVFARSASEATEESWIQVELIAYRNLDTTSAGDEGWPNDPVIGYPEALEILYDPDAEAQGIPEPVGVQPAADPAAIAEIQQAISAEDDFLADAEAEGERPYQRLPVEALQLNDAAKRIRGSRHYRLLSHMGWRQPKPPREQSVSVLVTGGDGKADHFELEGYITVSRSAFLHVAPTLWLNDFAPEASGGAQAEPGQEAPGGVLLPDIPRPEAWAMAPMTADGSAPPGEANGMPRDVMTSTTGTSPPDAPVVEASPADPAVANVSAVHPDEAIAAEPLRSQRTAVMRASRRAKIGELHYIDHPLFGLLVQITAYEPGAAEGEGDE